MSILLGLEADRYHGMAERLKNEAPSQVEKVFQRLFRFVFR